MLLVYGCIKGEPAYMEELLYECNDMQAAKRDQQRAVDRGYTNTRITNFEDGFPVFTKAITINR